jgi:hypothetical protein
MQKMKLIVPAFGSTVRAALILEKRKGCGATFFPADNKDTISNFVFFSFFFFIFISTGKFVSAAAEVKVRPGTMPKTKSFLMLTLTKE